MSGKGSTKSGTRITSSRFRARSSSWTTVILLHLLLSPWCPNKYSPKRFFGPMVSSFFHLRVLCCTWFFVEREKTQNLLKYIHVSCTSYVGMTSACSWLWHRKPRKNIMRLVLPWPERSPGWFHGADDLSPHHHVDVFKNINHTHRRTNVQCFNFTSRCSCSLSGVSHSVISSYLAESKPLKKIHSFSKVLPPLAPSAFFSHQLRDYLSLPPPCWEIHRAPILTEITL